MCQALVFDFLPTAGDHPSLDEVGTDPTVGPVLAKDAVAVGLSEATAHGLVAIGVLDGERVGCFLHVCIIPNRGAGVKR